MPAVQSIAEGLEFIRNTYFALPHLWKTEKFHTVPSSEYGRAATGSTTVQAVFHIAINTPNADFPSPGWRLLRKTGSAQIYSRDMCFAMHQTVENLLPGHYDYTPSVEPKYDSWEWLHRYVSAPPADGRLIVASNAQPGRGRGEFFINKNLFPDPPSIGVMASWSIILEARDALWSIPVIETFQRRKPRIYGKSDTPTWRKEHAEIMLGRKFSRQRDKLVEHPNEKGFGNDAKQDNTLYSKLKSKAVDIVKDAAIDGLKAGAKTIKDRAKKQVASKLKASVLRKLKETVRKR